jgi:hypothetical protein
VKSRDYCESACANETRRVNHVTQPGCAGDVSPEPTPTGQLCGGGEAAYHWL